MTRTNAREIVVHLIFHMHYTKESPEEAIAERFAGGYYETLQSENEVYAQRPSGKQMAYIRDTVSGIAAHREELEGYIAKYAIGWRLERISALARAIMELAMYEILYVDDVPTAAAISEAVELTRKYEDEDMVSFVNGILGSFVRGAGL